MQINLKTLIATYKKSSFISGIIVLESEGSRIEIWLSTRDLFNSRREIKLCFNVNGDLQGNHLMLFTTKCQHNG